MDLAVAKLDPEGHACRPRPIPCLSRLDGDGDHGAEERAADPEPVVDRMQRHPGLVQRPWCPARRARPLEADARPLLPGLLAPLDLRVRGSDVPGTEIGRGGNRGRSGRRSPDVVVRRRPVGDVGQEGAHPQSDPVSAGEAGDRVGPLASRRHGDLDRPLAGACPLDPAPLHALRHAPGPREAGLRCHHRQIGRRGPQCSRREGDGVAPQSAAGGVRRPHPRMPLLLRPAVQSGPTRELGTLEDDVGEGRVPRHLHEVAVRPSQRVPYEPCALRVARIRPQPRRLSRLGRDERGVGPAPVHRITQALRTNHDLVVRIEGPRHAPDPAGSERTPEQEPVAECACDTSWGPFDRPVSRDGAIGAGGGDHDLAHVHEVQSGLLDSSVDEELARDPDVRDLRPVGGGDRAIRGVGEHQDRVSRRASRTAQAEHTECADLPEPQVPPVRPVALPPTRGGVRPRPALRSDRSSRRRCDLDVRGQELLLACRQGTGLAEVEQSGAGGRGIGDVEPPPAQLDPGIIECLVFEPDTADVGTVRRGGVPPAYREVALRILEEHRIGPGLDPGGRVHSPEPGTRAAVALHRVARLGDPVRVRWRRVRMQARAFRPPGVGTGEPDRVAVDEGHQVLPWRTV